MGTENLSFSSQIHLFFGGKVGSSLNVCFSALASPSFSAIPVVFSPNKFTKTESLCCNKEIVKLDW